MQEGLFDECGRKYLLVALTQEAGPESKVGLSDDAADVGLRTSSLVDDLVETDFQCLKAGIKALAKGTVPDKIAERVEVEVAVALAPAALGREGLAKSLAKSVRIAASP